MSVCARLIDDPYTQAYRTTQTVATDSHAPVCCLVHHVQYPNHIICYLDVFLLFSNCPVKSLWPPPLCVSILAE